ncbi:MAG: hypothetical protein ACI9YL_001876 [Luteibaculaceae bacterium]
MVWFNLSKIANYSLTIICKKKSKLGKKGALPLRNRKSLAEKQWIHHFSVLLAYPQLPVLAFGSA